VLLHCLRLHNKSVLAKMFYVLINIPCIPSIACLSVPPTASEARVGEGPDEGARP